MEERGQRRGWAGAPHGWPAEPLAGTVRKTGPVAVRGSASPAPQSPNTWKHSWGQATARNAFRLPPSPAYILTQSRQGGREEARGK